MANPLLSPVLLWARKLRHPTLFKIVAVLFVLDLVIPFDDVLPPYFIDELLLGLATLGLASWKRRRSPPDAIDQAPTLAEPPPEAHDGH